MDNRYDINIIKLSWNQGSENMGVHRIILIDFLNI